MACRQRGQLDPPASEEAIRGDEQGIRSAKHSGRERRVDLAASAGIEELDLQPERVSGRFQLCQCGRRICHVARIYQPRHPNGCGHQLTQ